MPDMLLRLAAGLVALALFGARPAAAEPALWAVRDADSTVYLFGTVHVLRPDLDWWSPKLEIAFDGADELWLETDVGSALTMIIKLMRYGMDFGAPLSTKLSVAQQAKLAAVAAKAGLSPKMLEHIRPWLAALTLSTAPAMAQGYDDKGGADNTLERRAKEAGKALKVLETETQQLRFFADLPPETELAMLTDLLEQGAMPVEALDGMVEAWIAGDEVELAKVFESEDFDQAGVLYDVLIRRRNSAWADQIKTMMEGAGTSFIAVGAGHLVGPDSVQAALAKLGLDAERL